MTLTSRSLIATVYYMRLVAYRLRRWCSFLTAAISEREVTEKPINTSSSHTVTGDAPHPLASDLKVMALNASLERRHIQDAQVGYGM